jgi:hypothetical protein
MQTRKPAPETDGTAAGEAEGVGVGQTIDAQTIGPGAPSGPAGPTQQSGSHSARVQPSGHAGGVTQGVGAGRSARGITACLHRP